MLFEHKVDFVFNRLEPKLYSFGRFRLWLRKLRSTYDFYSMDLNNRSTYWNCWTSILKLKLVCNQVGCLLWVHMMSEWDTLICVAKISSALPCVSCRFGSFLSFCFIWFESDLMILFHIIYTVHRYRSYQCFKLVRYARRYLLMHMTPLTCS